ncbi:MAG: leucine-rich repeat domain-containing protein [Chlamydiota bacterium]
MQPLNIHDNLLKIKKNYSKIIKYPEKASSLLTNLFQELLYNPVLRSEEQSLVQHLFEDLCSLPVREHLELALAVQNYQQQAISTHLQVIPLLTRTYTPSSKPTPDFSNMTNKEILEYFKMDGLIKENEARQTLCTYIKDLQDPNLSSLPLDFSELRINEVPKGFLTDPFFTAMEINLSENVSLPADIKISEIRNLNVYKQINSDKKNHSKTYNQLLPLSHEKFLKEVFIMKDISILIFDYLILKDLLKVQRTNNSIKEFNSDYTRFRESSQILEDQKQRHLLPEDLKIFALSRKECNKMATQIHNENLSFLINLQEAGLIEDKSASDLDYQIMAQAFHDESLIKIFPRLCRALPKDIQLLWKGDLGNASEIRNFLHINKKELATIRSFIFNKRELKSIPPEIIFLTNLTSLTLENNEISDVSLLAKLHGLRTLELRGNRISDISPLAELPNLSDLDLSYNRISDISPLAELPDLRVLNLSYNRISDINPLEELQNLEGLHLDLNYISNLDSLQNQDSSVLDTLFILKQKNGHLDAFLSKIKEKFPKTWIE